MGIEIERKFLVASDGWRAAASSSLPYRQGYLSRNPSHTVRVRVAGERGWITVKTRLRGLTRSEWEYAIPAGDAAAMLALCPRPLIEKTRHLVPHAGHRWEVDEFHGENAGLVVAELEMAREDEAFERPPWLGTEVTQDNRYFNSWLQSHPFKTWS